MSAERVYIFLLIQRGGNAERIVVWDTQDITVGRAPDNDVVVEDAEMSRNHACFRKDGDAYRVDSHSHSNPTLVNGEAVTSQVLANNDVVRIAETELVFHRVTKNPVTLGVKTEFASQLKGFGPKVGGDGEATMLGLMDAVGGGDDDFQVRPAGDFDHDLAGMESPPAPRNLDLEIGDGLDELEIPAAPKQPVQEAWSLDEADAAPSVVALTLELEGLAPEQQRFLQGLLGKVIELPKLRIRIKGRDLA